jgi:hypothetical protein
MTLPVVLSSLVLAASVASACTVRSSIALSHDTPLSSSTVAKYVCAPVLVSLAKHCCVPLECKRNEHARHANYMSKQCALQL